LNPNHLRVILPPVRGEFIDLAGERLYYYAAGSRGTGEPVLLIHGFPTSSHLWLDVVAKLPTGHRIIVLDLLGYGRSDAPPQGDYSIAGHGNRVIKLLDALRVERACLVGHGTGGAIAQWVALNAPDRVTKIGLIGSSTSEGWFSKDHAFLRSIYDLALRMPSWFWFPILRGMVARVYSDPVRGKKSAEMYLARFVEGSGASVLRHHLAGLTNGQIAVVARRAHEVKAPIMSSPRSPWRFMPEENPSEVAAVIAQLLE
jgi:pimeloyl-ACP methyl ester carboxylesterase